jgi:hypothetical protein
VSANQIEGEFWQAVRSTFSPAILDSNVAVLQIAALLETLSEKL